MDWPSMKQKLSFKLLSTLNLVEYNIFSNSIIIIREDLSNYISAQA